MDPAFYIARRLEEFSQESEASLFLHQQAVPLLLSSLVLRFYQCGQMDVAGFTHPSQLILAEIKHTPWLKGAQYHRLRRTQDFLTRVFQCQVVLCYPKGSF